MATVYLADRLSTDGQAALKVLPTEAADDGIRRRFLRESGYATTLEHPNIPRVYDVGEADGFLYIASEFVPGTNLETLLALDGRLELDRALDILEQIAAALDAVHAKGIVHRDVEPANILVASGEGAQAAGQSFLTDFGLGKEHAAERLALTATSEFVGHSHYAAPEQILGKDSDHRADVYSLGCVLYECLVGEPPFPRDRETEVLYGHIEDAPPKPTAKRPELPPVLDDVVACALAKEPDARYGSCTALIDAARGIRSPEAIWLVVTAGNAPGKQIEVVDDLLIGRLAPAEGRLSGDVELSREHARISRTPEDAYVIEDLGSTNGTFVNGRQIRGAQPLMEGDTIEVGGTTLLVSSSPSVAAPSAQGMPESRAAETRASVPQPDRSAPAEPAASATPVPAPVAPARLSLRVEVNWDTRELLLQLDEESEPLRLLRENGGWRLAPPA
jgi:serine/threonine-protein kinase